MLDIHVQLLERSFVQEHIQALTRSQLTLGVLSSDAFLTAAQARGVTLGFKLFDNSLHRRPCFSCDISGDPFSAFTSACNCEFAKSCIHKILSQRRGFPDSLLPCGGGYEGLAACRSEEHTSELQSLMRISYAVFCLKTKNT